MRWIWLLAALAACGDRGTVAPFDSTSVTDTAIPDPGPIDMVDDPLGPEQDTSGPDDVADIGGDHHDQAVDALCSVIQDAADPEEHAMPFPLYKAINQNPVPNNAWSKIRFSTNVAENIVLPVAGLASFTVSTWAIIEPEEISSNQIRRIFAFGFANLNAIPSLQLYASAPNFPDKRLRFSALMDHDATLNSIQSTATFDPGVKRHLALVFEHNVALRLYVDGAKVAEVAAVGWTQANANDDAESGAIGGTGGDYNGPLQNIGIFDRAWSDDEVAAIAARGPEHYYSEGDGGDWAGETPPVEWSGAAVNGAVPNAGTGGACTFGVDWREDPYWGPLLGRGSAYPVLSYEEGDGAPCSVAKFRDARGRYPPIHHWLKTSGTGASRFALLSPIISRGFFPNGGGFGQASLSMWLKRPAVPASTAGTLIQVGSGDSFITVTIGPGEVPNVAITDGTTTVDADLPAWTLDRIRNIVLVIDVDIDRLKVYVDATEVADIDTSTVTPPDADVELEFTVGANVDGTDPIDVYFTGPVYWSAEVVTATEVQGIVDAGWTWDARDPYPIPGGTPGKWNPPTPDNPSGTSPVPDAMWRDEVIDGVVPRASPPCSPLVGFEATWETEPSTLHCWVISTHRLAVSSTAWWSDDDYDPASWILSYATAGHADVFGEVPRVVKVTDDPLSEAVLLDVDATLQPGVAYELVAPADRAGETP